MTIDWWTLCFQTVNVAVLIWLLQRFFWQPVSAMIEQRGAVARAFLADAETKRKDATEALAAVAVARAGLVQEGEAIRAAAHAETEKDSAAQRDEAGKAAAAQQIAARASIDKDRAATDAATSDRASHLAVDIAGHLATRLDGAAVQAAFLHWLVEAIEAIPEAERRLASDDGATLVAVSATPIAAADQERYRQAIGTAFGAHPQISFEADPTLIAGLDLRGDNLSVSNSWQADLARILAAVRS